LIRLAKNYIWRSNAKNPTRGTVPGIAARKRKRKKILKKGRNESPSNSSRKRKSEEDAMTIDVSSVIRRGISQRIVLNRKTKL